MVKASVVGGSDVSGSRVTAGKVVGVGIKETID